MLTSCGITWQISALSRELIFYKSRLDGLVRSVEIIGRWAQDIFGRARRQEDVRILRGPG